MLGSAHMSNDVVEALNSEADAGQAHVPKLRFTEFRDAGAWTRRPLSPYLREHTGRVSAHTEIPVYSSSRAGLTPQKVYFDGSNLQNLGEYSEVPDGFITYRHMSDDGVFKFNVNQTGGPIAVSKEYPVFTTSGISSPFLLNILNSSHDFTRFALSQKKGGTRTRLYLSVLRSWDPLLPPDEAEQQKIADCLASLDAVIAAEGDRLAALREYKKGLMEQLFPRPERIENGKRIPAETVPHVRFPEFQNAGDWEERSLGDLLECPPAYGVNAAAVTYDERLPTYLRITDISEDGRFIDADKTSVNVVATESNSMQPDDIALTRTGASVGKAYLHTTANGPLVFAGFLIRVRPDQRRALSQIVFQYMQTQAYWSWVLKTSARSGQPGLNSAEYSALRIPLPPDGPDGLREQRQIANCLSSVDDLAVALTDRIAALKAHKSGLMQQLFPSPAEASA